MTSLLSPYLLAVFVIILSCFCAWIIFKSTLVKDSNQMSPKAFADLIKHNARQQSEIEQYREFLLQILSGAHLNLLDGLEKNQSPCSDLKRLQHRLTYVLIQTKWPEKTDDWIDSPQLVNQLEALNLLSEGYPEIQSLINKRTLSGLLDAYIRACEQKN